MTAYVRRRFLAALALTLALAATGCSATQGVDIGTACTQVRGHAAVCK